MTILEKKYQQQYVSEQWNKYANIKNEFNNMKNNSNNDNSNVVGFENMENNSNNDYNGKIVWNIFA